MSLFPDPSCIPAPHFPQTGLSASGSDSAYWEGASVSGSICAPEDMVSSSLIASQTITFYCVKEREWAGPIRSKISNNPQVLSEEPRNKPPSVLLSGRPVSNNQCTILYLITSHSTPQSFTYSFSRYPIECLLCAKACSSC